MVAMGEKAPKPGVKRLAYHPGQLRALTSTSRVTLALGGVRSGKTHIGPGWMLKEIRARGPGDYLIAAPTYGLIEKAAQPKFCQLFERELKLGHYRQSPSHVFKFDDRRAAQLFGYIPSVPTNVFFMHATDPEALEAATFKAAWLDEAGQKKFRYASWEAIMRRLSFDEGRALLTTTPYNMGWLKTEVHDRWKAGDPRYNVIRFSTLENPFFPKAEYDRARETMQPWKFNMFYRGLFQRPAGLIYDVFNPDIHTIDPFPIPKHWKRYVGIDFGGINTAATFWAEDPASKYLYGYREYHEGGRTAREHAQQFQAGEPGLPAAAVGGSKSEGQWRNEFRQAGYPIREPDVTEVEVGIDRVYGMMKASRVYIFKGKCPKLLDELAGYSRELDDHGEPTSKIEDKEEYHMLDSLRYIGAWYARLGGGPGIAGIGYAGRQ